jgi:hypothetical protein
MLSGHDLLRMVAAAFGLKDLPADKSGILLRLQEFFNATHREGRRALLIVDEAQNLNEGSLEELRMLSNFQVQNAAPFQSFLVGQPQFRRIIANPDLEQLRQRVIASYHLGPMDKAETQAYVEHRLAHVGWKGDPRFEPAAMELIHSASGGIPRRINMLCNRLMLAGYLVEKHAFDVGDVKGIAREIRDELGPESALSSVPSVDAEPAPPPKVVGPGTHDLLPHLVDIEERLARLERTMGSAVRLLQRLLEPDRVSKPRTPIGH